MQIDEVIKAKQFKNPTFKIQKINYNYYESKFELNEINEEFTIKYIKIDYLLYQHFNIIIRDEMIQKYALSKYFDEYFIYSELLNKELSITYMK